MREIKRGMKFRYKSKYGDDYYYGVVESILTLGNDVSFVSTNNITYRVSEVEWLDYIREERLKELGIK